MKQTIKSGKDSINFQADNITLINSKEESIDFNNPEERGRFFYRCLIEITQTEKPEIISKQQINKKILNEIVKYTFNYNKITNDIIPKFNELVESRFVCLEEGYKINI